MTLVARLVALEKAMAAHDEVRLDIPYVWRMADGEPWQGIPTDQECAELGAYLVAERIVVPSLTWQGSVPETLATVRHLAGRASGRRTCRVVRGEPHKCYTGLSPRAWDDAGGAR
jgi:hypothetical protein